MMNKTNIGYTQTFTGQTKRLDVPDVAAGQFAGITKNGRKQRIGCIYWHWFGARIQPVLDAVCDWTSLLHSAGRCFRGCKNKLSFKLSLLRRLLYIFVHCKDSYAHLPQILLVIPLLDKNKAVITFTSHNHKANTMTWFPFSNIARRVMRITAAIIYLIFVNNQNCAVQVLHSSATSDQIRSPWLLRTTSQKRLCNFHIFSHNKLVTERIFDFIRAYLYINTLILFVDYYLWFIKNSENSEFGKKIKKWKKNFTWKVFVAFLLRNVRFTIKIIMIKK